MRPPRRLHLPSGRILTLDPRPDLAPRAAAPGKALFADAVELLGSGDLGLREGETPLDVRGLELRDFHALRAIAARLGWLDEAEVEVLCRNCAAPLRHRPCAALELGPFADGELNDVELDRTLDLSVAHPVPPIRIGPGRVAREITLEPVTVAQAAPLHWALRRRRLVVTDRVVRAMGIAAVGDERSGRVIAQAVARSTEASWGAIRDLFLAAHYPLRLASVATCPGCGARNDVDAPYDREFEPSGPAPLSNAVVFPDFDAFAERARAVFEERVANVAGAPRLAVESGVPACDDGGDPLLGSYEPVAGDPDAPVGTPEIAIYYRTFRAVWDEEGPYDWERELVETVEHELEHHAGWRVGHDAMDDEERDEIVRERVRIVGRRAAAANVTGALGAFAGDLRSFIAHTWPLWLIVAVAAAVTLCSR